ncbi:FMN-dependent NADH-azoreductase [Brevibacillus dissolubilis]|uniref:FMN-dependent NADH-azoreductase n=1 Tax=Brevibacillus dissolubilis TaxID=1844116 RepID=UPI0011178B59|nr:FMN-dependent NADH-azoreductase [Brevibacillus dissolubilis]
MAQVLYIIANPQVEEYSFGLQVGKEFVSAYREANPQDEVVTVDLYNIDLPLIDKDVLTAWGALRQGTEFTALSAAQQQKVSRIGELTDQFAAADKYVFVSPMWNLSYTPLLKAYIDTFLIAGKTFKYTENGPVGLLAGKKAVHIQARGGIYSEPPGSDLEFGDKHLRAVLGFIGITDVETIAVEGMAAAPQDAENIKSRAIDNARDVAKRF